MATDLTGLQVRNTYNSLLKIGDNTSLTGIAKRISDGLGNDSPLFISTSQISIGVAPATGYDLTVNSGIRTGSIDVLGAATAQTLQFTGGDGTQGTMSWNTDEETVDLIQNGATLQLGQEIHVHVRNNTGSTINDGTPVYVTGTLGASGRLTVAPMIADGSIPAKYFIGVTTEDIPNGEDGKVTTFGKIRGINTSAYSEGQTLYVSSTTAGYWQTTPPAAPGLDLEAAIVISSKNNGTLFVRVNQGQYLGMLHDVYLNSLADNQLLVYNATNSRWENQGIASIGAINLDTVTDNGNTTTNSISVGDINAGNVTLTGYLRGAANFVIDPAAHGDETGTVQILGNLRVDGTTTTINSTTVTIADKNIVLAEGSALPGDANGAGITIDGAGASMTYNSAGDSFVFNKVITASSGLNGLTLTNGISGTNFNITGVNQLEIADPGEGIVWKAGSSGDMILAIVDDTSDNRLNLSGTGASMSINDEIVATQNWVDTNTLNQSEGDARYVNLSGDEMTGGLGTQSLLIASGGNTGYLQGKKFIYTINNTGSAGNTWRKVCDVIIGTGTFAALSMDIVFNYPGSNHGASASLSKYYYSASFRRSSGIQNNPNDAVLYGYNPNYIRIVKTSTGNYELQAKAGVDNQAYFVEYTVTNSLVGSVIPTSGVVSGSTTGDIYTATTSNTTATFFGGSISGTEFEINSNVVIDSNRAFSGTAATINGDLTANSATIKGDVNIITTGVLKMAGTEVISADGDITTDSVNSGGTLNIDATTQVNLRANGDLKAYVDSSGFNVVGGLNLGGVDGISLTDDDSTTDSFFHANIDYDAGLYQITSDARYGADYIQVDGNDTRGNTVFAISPKDSTTTNPDLFLGGNNSVTAPNTLTDWRNIKMNATSVQINGAEVATRNWVTSQSYLTAESDTLDSVTDRNATTTNSITVGGIRSNTYDSTGTGNYRKAFIDINSGNGAQKYKIHSNYNVTDGFAHFKVYRAYDYGNNDQSYQEAIYQRRGTSKNLKWKIEGDYNTSDDVFLEFYVLPNDTVETWLCVDDYAQVAVEIIYIGTTDNSFSSPSSGTPTGTLIHSTDPDSNTPNWDIRVGNIKSDEFVKSGGTSSQFLKADGSVDSSSYALSSIDLQDVTDNGNITDNNIVVQNTSTSAVPVMEMGQSSTQFLRLHHINSGYSSSGTNIANSGLIVAGGGSTGGLVLRTDADAPIIFATNGIANERFRINGNGNIKFTNQQNGVSRLELYQNRQDLSNVGIWTIAAYNSAEVANISFFRGSGGNSGYTKIFSKKDNASSLEEVVQFGDNGTLTSTFRGDIHITSGSVGIGTTSPDYPLDVESTEWTQARFTSTSSGYAPASILLETGAGSSTSRGQGIFLYSNDSDTTWFSGTAYSDNNENFIIAYKTNTSFNSDTAQKSNALLTINNGGSVGIGETSIDAKLHLTASSAGLINQKFESQGSAAWRIGIPASQTYFAFDNANDNLSTPKVVIDSSGRLGINTSHPDKLLDIKTGTTASGVHYLQTLGGSSHLTSYAVGIGFDPEGYGNRNKVAIVAEGMGSGWSAGRLHFLVRKDIGTSAEADLSHSRMMIDENGLVGVGLTSPDEQLDVNGRIRARQGFSGTDGSAKEYYWYSNNTGNSGTIWRKIGTYNPSGQSSRIMITAVGTASYGGGQSSGKTTIVAQVNNNNLLEGSWWQEVMATQYNAVGFVSHSSTSHDIYFQVPSYSEYAFEAIISDGTFTPDASTVTAPTFSRQPTREWNVNANLWVKSDSRVGIGNSSPPNRLTIGSGEDIQSTNGIGLGIGEANIEFLHATYQNGFGSKIYSVDSGSGVTSLRIATRGNVTSWTDAVTINAASTGVNANVGIRQTSPSYALDVTGTIRASSDIIAFSDARVKENVKTIDNALDKVTQLRGVSYNKIGETEEKIGVIAQEIEKVLPQVVQEDAEGMKSVAYGNIVGVLIEAIKEQQKQIDELKAMIK